MWTRHSSSLMMAVLYSQPKPFSMGVLFWVCFATHKTFSAYMPLTERQTDSYNIARKRFSLVMLCKDWCSWSVTFSTVVVVMLTERVTEAALSGLVFLVSHVQYGCCGYYVNRARHRSTDCRTTLVLWLVYV